MVFPEALIPPADIEQPTETTPLSKDTLGLLYIGYLTEVVEIFGSKVALRTLKIGEELEAELLVAKYRDTQEENRAYATALVAASIVSVDGRPLVQGLGPFSENLESKFNYITENWHWITVATLYSKYNDLLERSIASIEEVKKK